MAKKQPKKKHKDLNPLRLEIEAAFKKHGIQKALIFVNCPDCDNTSSIIYLDEKYFKGLKKQEQQEMIISYCVFREQVDLHPEWLVWAGIELEEAEKRLTQADVIDIAKKVLGDEKEGKK